MNGQNVPRSDNDTFKIRNLHIAEKGKILYLIDFSGFELRIIAWKANEATMLNAFKHNEDLHRKTASNAYGVPESTVTKMQRTFGKVVNFLHNYGGGPLAVHENFKTMGIRVPVEFCQELLHAVDKTYPNLAKYSKEIAAYAQDRGYVDTIYGYKRLLPFINSSNHKMRSGSERQASNSPIQGSAADIMKRCQNDIYDELAKKVFPYNDVKMCAQVHDEIIFELPDNMEQLIAFDKAVKAIMEREPIPNFPIDIVAESSTGYKWGEKKDFKY